ncbi:hypothetical protein [Neobacillus mesonae]|uniref:hypothetical protein n=1 Tax=Neobacillus mesonae TaxID=1193713 RepID=UPI00203F463A|nr:hypothetical protein [Neobacillus mesonae]MCM3569748.1 hypothetical protein [Neobacillus mesonae]
MRSMKQGWITREGDKIACTVYGGELWITRKGRIMTCEVNGDLPKKGKSASSSGQWK